MDWNYLLSCVDFCLIFHLELVWRRKFFKKNEMESLGWSLKFLMTNNSLLLSNLIAASSLKLRNIQFLFKHHKKVIFLINVESERKPTPISIFSGRGYIFLILSRSEEDEKDVFLSLVHSRPSLLVVPFDHENHFGFFLASRKFWEQIVKLRWRKFRLQFSIVVRSTVKKSFSYFVVSHSKEGARLAQMFWGRKLITGCVNEKSILWMKNWSIAFFCL